MAETSRELRERLRLLFLAKEFSCLEGLGCGEGDRACAHCWAASKLESADAYLAQGRLLDAHLQLSSAGRRCYSFEIERAADEVWVAMSERNMERERRRRPTSATAEVTPLPPNGHRFWRLSKAEQEEYLEQMDKLSAGRKS